MKVGLLMSVLAGYFLLIQSVTGNTGTEDELISMLLDGYSKDARPPPSNEATDVHVAFFILSLDDVEEHQQIMTVSGFILATWSDSRLAWNKSEWYGTDRVVLSANLIWKPDMALTDAVGDVYNSAFFSDYYGISVDPSGNVSWTLFGSTSVRCDFILTYYPFDTQTCEFSYESFNYPSYLLNLYTEFETINLDDFHESSEFTVVNTTAITTNTYYEGDGNYSTVVFRITIKRRELYFMLNLVLPCILLTALSCFLFLLPVSSGERVSLSVTILLSFSVFQLIVAQNLPMNSLYTPLLTVFILSAMFTNGLSLTVTILILRTSQKGAEPIPPWIEKYILQKLGVSFGLVKKASRPRSRVSSSSAILINVANVEKPPPEHSSHAIPTPDKLAQKLALQSLLSVVSSIERLLSQRDDQDAHKDKWVTVSRVVDILMLILFSTGVTFLCIICLAIIPSQHT